MPPIFPRHICLVYAEVGTIPRYLTRWDEDLPHTVSVARPAAVTHPGHIMSIQTKQSHQSFLEIRQQINASDAGQLADSAFMHYCTLWLPGPADHMLI